MPELRGPGPLSPGAAPPDLRRWAPVVAQLPWGVAPEPLWQPGPRQGRWFGSGRLDAATTCVGRHAAARPDALALAWEGEPGDRRTLTYAALADEVAALARGLSGLGVGAGDVVAVHLGPLPEAVFVLLACAQLGAVCSVIPTPLPAEALAARLTTLAPRLLVTQDGAWRRGAVLPLKSRADDALSAVDVEHTVVVRRTGIDVGWFEGDRWYHDIVEPAPPRRGGAGSAGSPELRPRAAGQPDDRRADHPMLLVSLAQRRGRPQTVVHGVAAVLTSALAMHRYGLVDGEVTWCAGDLSWLGTLAHGIYGPLAAGATAVLYEGTLDVPTHARAWQILAEHRVSTLLTTPSVLRMMRSWSIEVPEGRPSADLRRVVAFGEPVDPDVRHWAGTGLAGGGIPVADAWGQVELGGIVLVDDPVAPQLLPGVGERILGAHELGAGAEGMSAAGELTFGADGGLAAADSGELVLTRPWPGTMIGAVEPVEALEAGHWGRIPGAYATGDLARPRPDGGLEYLGRTDEITSVSGQLVSLCEIREVLLAHPLVVAADVFERRDPLGARVVAAAVVLTDEAAGLQLAAVASDLGLGVREVLGGLARPRQLLVVDRFGDELRGDERRRALAALPVGDPFGPARVKWSQVIATARHGLR